MDIVNEMRGLEEDHEPDGWPAVRMRQISALCDEIERLRGAIEAWTNERPTAPGWFWYQDPDYGPAPVHLAWTGFIDVPAARQLDIDMCTGEDQDILGMSVAELDGEWHPLDVPN